MGRFLRGRFNLCLNTFAFPNKSTHLLRMVMEPKYYAEEVTGHPDHSLTI